MRTLAAVLIATLFSAAAAGESMTIGLMLAGSATDQGWNQLAKDGMDAAAKRLGAKVVLLQKVAQDKAGDELRAFATDGCRLVVAHGYEFLTPAVEAARTATTARFAVSGADVERPGIATLDFDLSQASYQIGMIAGRLTRTNKLGYLGGAPFPSVQACLRGFTAGAKAVNPAVEVVAAYTSWDDREKNKAQTEAFLRAGVDQIYPNVDAAATAVLEAVAAANVGRAAGAQVNAYGCVGDRNGAEGAGRFVPASAVISFENAFLHLAESVAAGSFATGVHREGIATGTCVIRRNPAVALPEDLVTAIEAAGKKLATGELTIPRE
jgi:basic membrane protein A